MPDAGIILREPQPLGERIAEAAAKLSAAMLRARCSIGPCLLVIIAAGGAAPSPNADTPFAPTPMDAAVRFVDAPMPIPTITLALNESVSIGDEGDSSPASAVVKIEKITDTVERVLHTKARIDPGESVALGDEQEAVYSGHSHKMVHRQDARRARFVMPRTLAHYPIAVN